MLSNIDKLLLSSSQQAEVQRMKQKYMAASAVGDTAGMQDAHARAEEIRAAAGYSGGAGGDRYQLLRTANAPAGYNAYEKIIEDTVNTGMHAIAAGYQHELEELARQRGELAVEGVHNQAAARSAVWNQHRLAADGLLTRGLSDTGVADVITATALNQASANAYQALLDRQNDMAENTVARASAKADALGEAAELQAEVGKELAEGYTGFYEMESELEKLAKDYYYQLALQQLKLQSK